MSKVIRLRKGQRERLMKLADHPQDKPYNVIDKLLDFLYSKQLKKETTNANSKRI
jgi:hypothetical protein